MFESSTKLKDFVNVLSTNKDRKGREFVSSWEAKEWPVFAVQVSVSSDFLGIHFLKLIVLLY